MKEVIEKRYIAEDGTSFTNKEECLYYEEEILKTVAVLRKIRFFNSLKEEIKLSVQDILNIFNSYNNNLELDINIGFEEVWMIKIPSSLPQEELNQINSFLRELPDIGVFKDVFTQNTNVLWYDENENNFVSLNGKIKKIQEEIEYMNELFNA